MAKEKTLFRIIDNLLRIGIIAFIFPFFFEGFIEPDTTQVFWSGLIKITLVVVFIGLSVIVLIISRRIFKPFGFFLVFVGSLYRILFDIFQQGFDFDLFAYLLLLIASLYFITKPARRD